MLKSNTHIRFRLQAHIIAAVLLCGPWFTSASLACSVFSPDGSSVLAGNYDWTVGNGVIFTNGSGLQKQAFLKSPLDLDGKRLRPAVWQSRYASLTLTQWGREFPMQGINEAGLTGVVLNAPAEYPVAGTTPYVISEMQWLQFQLDSYSSVSDVARHASDFGVQVISARLHFFMCDDTKDCALIEFTNGRVQVHRQSSLSFRAITNSSYDDSYQAWLASGRGQAPLPTGYASLHRIVRAANYAANGDSAFTSVLNSLRDLGTTGWTNWHTVFEAATQELVVTPWQSKISYSIRRSEYVAPCDRPQQMRRIQNGVISNWTTYDRAYDAEVLARAAAPIGGFSSSLQQRMVDYQSGLRCTFSKF